jgi:hypothetical protein
VPRIDSPIYNHCDGIDFAECLAKESCVCDGGRIPDACAGVKAELDSCVLKASQ